MRRSGASGSPPPTDAVEAPTEDELRLALLSLDDVPNGWAHDTTGDPTAVLQEYAPLAVDKAIRGLG